jgi:hypothetical protein
MRRNRTTYDNNVVSISALDVFANAVGSLAFILLLFAVNAIELAQPSGLKILTERVPVSQAGSEYISVLSVIGGVPPYSWTLQSGSLPEGLALDQKRGEILGTPNSSAAGGSFPFEVAVSDSRKKSARSRFEIRVQPAKSTAEAAKEQLVLLTHGELPDATAAQPYSIYLAARGGSGRYRWSAEALPQGLTIAESSGLIKGAPTAAGTHQFVLRVSDEREGGGDAGKAVATASLRVIGTEAASSVSAVAVAARILTASLPPATESQSYEITLSGTGAQPLRWSARNLPLGLRLGDDGVIRGEPVAPTKTQIVISMEDARNSKAPEKVLELVVNPPPLTAMDRLKGRGFLWWLGCVLGYAVLGLGEVGFLKLLDIRAGRELAAMLRAHGVDFIRKADGTGGLSGSPEATEVVQRWHKEMFDRQRKLKKISYALLSVAIIGYTIFLLS